MTQHLGRIVIGSSLVALTACTSTPEAPSVVSGHETPKRYVCPRAVGPIVIDGRPDEPGWVRAPRSDVFADIEGAGRPAPRFETWMKMTWDDDALYVAAWLAEPHVWGTLSERDQIVFHDNDFEVFIDPNGDTREYYEVEVNALNTIFDLFLAQTYRAGGPADHDWNCAGLETAIAVEGTLNDPTDTDRGWWVEMALPWAAIGQHAHRPAPPRPGDVWRINFSRVEWRHEIRDTQYAKVEGLREDNWVWSPQGEIDMHIPERWGFLEFAD